MTRTYASGQVPMDEDVARFQGIVSESEPHAISGKIYIGGIWIHPGYLTLVSRAPELLRAGDLVTGGSGASGKIVALYADFAWVDFAHLEKPVTVSLSSLTRTEAPK